MTCTIPNCDFIREAEKFYDHQTALHLNNVRLTDEFQQLVNNTAKFLNYHEDATITLKSFLQLVPVYNLNSSTVIQNTKPDLTKSLKLVAEGIVGKENLTMSTMPIKSNGQLEQRTCVTGLSYAQAENISLAYNQSNPFAQLYVASIERGSNSYSVVIRDRNDDTYNQMKENIRFKAIEAVCKWFDNLGITVTFDNINKALSAKIVSSKKLVTNAEGFTEDVLTSLVSICGDNDLKAIDKIPENIGDDVANAVSKILIDVFSNAEDRDVGPRYKRFKEAAHQYAKEHNMSETTSDEEIMQMFLKDEIKDRFLKALNKAVNSHSLNKIDSTMRHGRTWAGRFIDSIVSKWKKFKEQYKKTIKPISIKNIRREARLALDEMFDKKQQYVKTHQGSVEAGVVRKHHKRLLKSIQSDCKDAFDICYSVERALKKYINAVTGKEHKQRLTEFENFVAMLNDTDDVFSNSQVRALQAVGQTVLTLAYELDLTAIDIRQLAEQLDNMSLDSKTMHNSEYVDKLREFARVKQKFDTMAEIHALLLEGVNKKILTSEVSVIQASGNVASLSLRDKINSLTQSVVLQREAMNKLNATVAENFLIDIWGRDLVEYTHSKTIRSLLKHKNEIARNPDKFKKTRDIIHDLLNSKADNVDWPWLAWFGSSQNSTSVINQLVGLAINQAKTIGQQETQKTLSIIHKMRREWKVQEPGIFKSVFSKDDPIHDVSELVERDGNHIPTGNLIRPIDYAKYEKELAEAEEQWGNEFKAKYKDQQLNDTQKAIYWSAFRQNKFNEWNKKVNPITRKIEYKYKKQQIKLTNPRTGEVDEVMIYAPNPDLYPNAEWNSLPDRLKKLSDQFIALKYYSNQKLDGLGSALHKIPTFRGSFTDTVMHGGLNMGYVAMLKFRRNFIADLEDTEFGSVVSEIPMMDQAQGDWSKAEMDSVKRIPLYGIRKLSDMTLLSTDLFSSYLAYDDMANQYATKSSIEAMIQAVGEQIQKNDIVEDQYGKSVESSRYYAQFLNYVDKELYGVTKKSKINHNAGVIGLQKTLNFIGRITTAAFLGGNVHSALVNLITGYNEIIKEAGVGQYINIKDFTSALGFYIKHSATKIIGFDNDPVIGHHWNVLSHPNDSTNAITKILRSFDFTERYQADTRKYNSREARMSRLLKNSLMLPYEYTDHWMQAIPLICFLKHQKVYTQPETGGDSHLITLLEALFPETKDNRYSNLLLNPKGIDNDGNFGLFYKTAKDAEEGTKIVSLIQKLNQHSQNLLNNPNSMLNLSAEDVAVLNEYNLPLNMIDNAAINNAVSTLKSKLYVKTYNGADFAQTRLLAREIVNRMHGVYDTQSKGAFARTIYGATIMSMKNYAVGLINKRFGQPHYSVLTDNWDEGSFWTVSKIFADGWQKREGHNRFIYFMKNFANLVVPFMMTSHAAKERMANRTGFTITQIHNMRRFKLDIGRIMFFLFLTHLTKALSKGWFGGWDPEDPELFYEYTGLNIDREDILDESTFEEGGKLASNPKLSDIYNEIKNHKDFKELYEGLTPFEKQVWKRIKKDAAKRTQDGDASIEFDSYGSGKEGFGGYLDKIYKEEEKMWNARHKEDEQVDISKGNRKVSYKHIVNFCKNNLITTNSVKYKVDDKGNYVYTNKDKTKHQLEYKVRTTPMAAIQQDKKDTSDAIKELEYEYKYTADSDTKKRIKTKLDELKKRYSGLNDIVHGYNYWKAKRDNKKLTKDLEEWGKRAGVTDKNLEKMSEFFSNREDTDNQAFRLFRTDYEKNLKTLKNQEKYFAGKNFEQEYFENTHPAAYYWLGVANYFIVRGLIELESLIPGAGFLTQTVEKVLTETIPKWASQTYYNITGSKKKGKALVPTIEREYEWNFTNEWSSLTEGFAALGLGRSLAKFEDMAMGSLLYSSEYVDKLREAEEQYRKELDDNYKNSSQRSREEIVSNRENLWEAMNESNKYISQNTTSKLKEGEEIWRKWPKGFTPYLRSAYQLGLMDYINQGKIDGGWRATESYKSMYMKDRR